MSRLFEELDRKVVAQTDISSANHLNRYNPEGANNALRFPDHWIGYEGVDTLVIEPFRARAFKLLKDLAVDRSALDQIIAVDNLPNLNHFLIH